MSAEIELQQTLLAASAVTALAGDRIATDRVEQGEARPFVVFSRTATETHEGLDGTVFAARVTLELQVWADTRKQAEALAGACAAAVRTAGQAVVGRSSGYDGDLDLEATLLTVEWWE